jgi:hypothetical protein
MSIPRLGRQTLARRRSYSRRREQLGERGGQMPIKSVVEYIEDAERELVAAETSTGHSTESRYHTERAQVFATLALAKATYDQAG